MYGNFLSVLEAKSIKNFEKLEFDYYEDFIYISFYHRSHNTLYIIPYTVKFWNIERFREDYGFLADSILSNIYSKHLEYDFPNEDKNKTHLI